MWLDIDKHKQHGEGTGDLTLKFASLWCCSVYKHRVGGAVRLCQKAYCGGDRAKQSWDCRRRCIYLEKCTCLGCIGKCSSVLYALLVLTYVPLFLSANKYVHNRQHIHNLHVISIGGIIPFEVALGLQGVNIHWLSIRV